jgi:hypothetical protein
MVNKEIRSTVLCKFNVRCVTIQWTPLSRDKVEQSYTVILYLLRIIKALVCIICLSLRLWQITQTSADNTNLSLDNSSLGCCGTVYRFQNFKNIDIRFFEYRKYRKNIKSFIEYMVQTKLHFDIDISKFSNTATVYSSYPTRPHSIIV